MRRLLLLLGAVALLAACSDDDDGTNPTTPSITLTASASSGSVARGASGTTTLTLGRLEGYAGAVALTAEGAPTGVTVAFAPQSLTGSTLTSTATISVGTTAAPGNATLTFRATGSGVTDKTVTYALTIPAPAITLSVGAGTATGVQGGTATVPITITRTNGASGAITLTAEGLPTGVTAAFAPASIPDGSNTSTLTLTIGATAAVATTPVVVRAASTGLTDQTATVQLSVTASTTPAYTITAAPAALSLSPGGSGNSTLTIARTGGFADNVQLALQGAPAGVTGTFTPNPATANTSTLAIATTAATVPGIYNLTVRGTATGLTDRTAAITLTVAPPPGITVTLLPTTLSIAQSGSAQTAITLARVGALTGDIAMTVPALPVGMTVAFAPATVTGSSSTATVTVGAAVAPGTYNLTITATGTGNVVGTATLGVTVTALSGFTLAATNVTVAQGGTTTSTITITRIGGYPGAVQLNGANVPANVNASFSPNPSTTGTSTLTITAAVGAVVGTYTMTVNGTGPAAADQSTTLTITVTASGGGGGNIAWRFCDPARVPLWFAFRNGATGTWTRVTPSANNTFSFTLTGAVGAVAYVSNVGGVCTLGTIHLLTAAEMGTQSTNECTQNPPGKSLGGSVAGLSGASPTASVTVGGSTATSTIGSPAYTLADVNDGVTDLLAVRSATTFSGTSFSSAPDRGVLRRGVNYGAGSGIPLIDLAGTESFALGTATITLVNAGSDNTGLLTTLYTANGVSGNFFPFSSAPGGASVTQYGLPTAMTQAGDLHLALASATSADGFSIRAVYQFNRNVADRTLTFGAALTAPTTTVQATAPYARLRTRSTWQAEYGQFVSVDYSPSTGAGNSWSLSGSRDYFGAAATEYEFELYDFSGVAGFNNSWGFAAGTATSVTTTAFAGTGSGPILAPTEGNAFKAATRIQQVIP